MPKYPVFSREQCDAYVDAANPHQWLLTADNLHSQAVALWRTRGSGQLAFSENGKVVEAWDYSNRSTFLLAAFAMENMLKAFRIYEAPALIADGYLKNDIATHNLPALAEGSSLVPYRVRDRWVYQALFDGNESWMRYPCGRNADDVRTEQQFTVKLWVKYCDMMAAYMRKMKSLLEQGWVGPYGYYGKWTFEGEF